MPVARRIAIGLVGGALVIAVTACRPALAPEASPTSGSRTLATMSETPALRQSGAIVWGRVPYCNCLAGSATATVAGALKDAHLTAGVKELSPRDGWLYFAVTFDSRTATREQISAAIAAGGGHVIEGPP